MSHNGSFEIDEWGKGARTICTEGVQEMRHDKIAAIIHWHLCKNFCLSCCGKSYEHFVEKDTRILENEDAKILWDFSIQTESKIEHNKLDVALLEKSNKVCFVLDVACPFDMRVIKKEKEKIEFYTDLKYEILKCWKHEVEKVVILPIGIGALGTVTGNVKRNLEKLGINLSVDVVQKTGLLGTARILRKVLDMQ